MVGLTRRATGSQRNDLTLTWRILPPTGGAGTGGWRAGNGPGTAGRRAAAPGGVGAARDRHLGAQEAERPSVRRQRTRRRRPRREPEPEQEVEELDEDEYSEEEEEIEAEAAEEEEKPKPQAGPAAVHHAPAQPGRSRRQEVATWR
jgi:hypothetical protein